MLYYVNRLCVWLMRAFHCRGFGVQSPADYAFIRYVVNEHYPYYAYADLQREMPGVDRLTGKLCRLYFRVANFLQPQLIVDCHPEPSPASRYMRAGCRRATIVNDVAGLPADAIGLLVLPLCGDYEQTFECAMQHADCRSVFILEGIKRDRRARRFWRRVKADGRVGVTFDLYYAGVAFFDTKRYKQDYIVNF